MQTLWAAAEGKDPVAVRLDELSILDEVVWFGGPKDVLPTVRLVAERYREEAAEMLDVLIGDFLSDLSTRKLISV